MTQEQKAEAYDKVREIITIIFGSNVAEEIFSEFEDSEDEKIRKKLISFVENWKIFNPNSHFDEYPVYTSDEGTVNKILAWLEKVGEDNKFLQSIKVGDIITKSPDGILINLGQSDRALEHSDKVLEHSDKIEPKFKVGDWITNGACIIKITSIDDRYYWHDNDCVGGDIESINKEYHLWNIQDAKEGDILANDKVICVYKERVSEHVIKVSINYSRKEDIETHYEVIGDFNLYPATKEERDFFFSKLK